MIIIFDFDRTLFDNKRFFEEDMPKRLGIEPEKFLRSIEENFKNKETGSINYNFDRHLQILKAMNIVKKDDDEINKIVGKMFDEAYEYLMPGASGLLESFKRSGADMHLATLGDLEWQKRKVESIRLLENYFDNRHRIFTDKNKAEAVEFLKETAGEIIIINDKPAEATAMENAIGRECQIYIVKSKYSENSDYGGRIYENLDELRRDIFPE